MAESPPELSERLTRIYAAYLHELASYPLAMRAFLIEIRAAGAGALAATRRDVTRTPEGAQMPNLSEHDNDPPPERRNRSLLVPVIIVVVVIFVLLHLTGVIGAGSH